MNTTGGGILGTVYYTGYDKINQLTNESLSLKSFNYLLVAVVAAVFVSIKIGTQPKKAKKQPTAKSGKAGVVDINKNRKLGHWIPDHSFKTPTPSAYPNWDFNKTQPIPYRAFKHNYKVNMGIRNMNFDDWIQLDNQWGKYHQDKLDRIEAKGTELYSSGDALEAAYELCEEFRNWLPERYPTLFKKTDLGIDNLQTGESFVFMKEAEPKLGKFSRSDGVDPILIAAKLVQDDLAIMLESETGEYYLKGGAIMLAGFWRLRDKINLPLSAIHTTGDVPKYKTHLKSGMEKFFTRLTCDKPVVRNNYFIQTDDDLPWSRSIGDEDNKVVGWYTAKESVNINDIYFRSERQSLRRLPKTGAVVFTIRTYFIPITEICEEPHIPRRLYDGMLSWSDDVAEYKGYEKYRDVLLPYLLKKAEEQEARGITVEKEPQVYPF